MKMAIVYGSTTGNTEMAAEKIRDELAPWVDHFGDIAEMEPNDLMGYSVLLLGVPTWNIGEFQYDWEAFLPNMTGLDFSGVNIGLFGMGDSFGFPDNFLDALGLLWKELQTMGKPELIGKWPTSGYTFTESVGLHDPDHFLGLGLDEENEPDRHEARVKGWTDQIKRERGLVE